MPMKNSKMPDDWLNKVVAQYPIAKLANGNIRTCPVRLAFEHLTSPVEKTNDDGKKSLAYDCVLLFPPAAQQGVMQVMWAEWCAIARKDFPENWNPQGQPYGLHWPLHPQDEKQNYTGYTPGCLYVNVGSQFKPALVDAAMNPIVDPSRVYSGVWALVALNAYSYGKQRGAKKKGVSFGLQSVMIIADDEKLAGAGSDPAVDFAGVSIDAAYDPAGAFGAGPVPGSILPPAQPVMPGTAGTVLPPPGFGAPGMAAPPVTLDDVL